MIAFKVGYLSALQRTHELVRFDATTQTIAGHLVRLLRGIGRVRAYPIDAECGSESDP